VVLVKLPPDYRNMPPGHQRIPYGQMKKELEDWERDRHWGGGLEGLQGTRPTIREASRGGVMAITEVTAPDPGIDRQIIPLFI
jgi:hypothetical protein